MIKPTDWMGRPWRSILAQRADLDITNVRRMRELLSASAPEGTPRSELAAVFARINDLDNALYELVVAEQSNGR